MANPAPGYMGKDKTGCFLAVYSGLESLEICGLGEHSPDLGAVLVHGASLRTLVLDAATFWAAGMAKTLPSSLVNLLREPEVHILGCSSCVS